jgi:hypothetical protein
MIYPRLAKQRKPSSYYYFFHFRKRASWIPVAISLILDCQVSGVLELSYKENGSVLRVHVLRTDHYFRIVWNVISLSHLASS